MIEDFEKYCLDCSYFYCEPNRFDMPLVLCKKFNAKIDNGIKIYCDYNYGKEKI